MPSSRTLAALLGLALVASCGGRQRAVETSPIRTSSEGGDFEYREGAVPATSVPGASASASASASGATIEIDESEEESTDDTEDETAQTEPEGSVEVDVEIEVEIDDASAPD